MHADAPSLEFGKVGMHVADVKQRGHLNCGRGRDGGGTACFGVRSRLSALQSSSNSSSSNDT